MSNDTAEAILKSMIEHIAVIGKSVTELLAMVRSGTCTPEDASVFLTKFDGVIQGTLTKNENYRPYLVPVIDLIEKARAEITSIQKATGPS